MKPDLCTIIVEDPHQTDRNCLVDTATQSFPGECEHKWHPLFTTHINDGVESLIQATCEGDIFLHHYHSLKTFACS